MKPNEAENQKRSGIEGYTPFVVDTRVTKKPKQPLKKPPQLEERDVQYKRLPELSKPDFDPRRLFPHKFQNPAPSRTYAQPQQHPKQTYSNYGGGDVHGQYPNGGYSYRNPKPRYHNPPAENFGYTSFQVPQHDIPKEPPQFPDPQINEYKQFPPLRDPTARNYRGRKPQYDSARSCSKTDAQAKTVSSNDAKNSTDNRLQNDPQAKAFDGLRVQGEPGPKVARGLAKGDPRAVVGNNKTQSIDGNQPQVAGNKPQDDPKSFVTGNPRPQKPQGDPRFHKPQSNFRLQGDPRPQKFQSDSRPQKLQDDSSPYRQQKHNQPQDESSPQGGSKLHKPQNDPSTQKSQGDQRPRKQQYHKLQDDQRFYKPQDESKSQDDLRHHQLQGDPQDDPRHHQPQGDPRFYKPQDKPLGDNYKPYGDTRAYSPQDDPRLFNPNDDSQYYKPPGDPRPQKPQGDYRAYKPHDDPRLYNPENDYKSYKGEPPGNKPHGEFKYNKAQGDAKAVGSNRPQGPIGSNRPQGDSRGAKPQDFKGAKSQGDPRGARPKGDPKGSKNQSDAARILGSKAHQELKAQLLAGTKITKCLSEREKRLLIEDLANDLQKLMREAREAANPEIPAEPPKPAELPKPAKPPKPAEISVQTRADSICKTCTAKTVLSEPHIPHAMLQVPAAVNIEHIPPATSSNELVVMKQNTRNESSDSSLQELRSLWRNMPRTAHSAPAREQCHVLFDPEFEKWKDPPPEEAYQNQAAALDPNRRPQYWVDFDMKKEIGQPLVVYNVENIDNNKEMRLTPKWVHPEFKLEQRRNEARGKEQVNNIKQAEQQGAKKKRPYSAQNRGAPTPCTNAHNTVAIYTVQNSVPPVCSVHATAEHKVVHTSTTTVAYMTPTHTPELYTQPPPPVYPSTGYAPIYPSGYSYPTPPTTHSQPYYVPEHVPPHQVYGAYQQISQSHYYPQGYTEHHYVSQYRGNQSGWYYPQRYPAVYVPVHPGNNYTQYTRSERVFIQSNRMEVRSTNANIVREPIQPSRNAFMMKCPLPPEKTATPQESAVTITEVDDATDNVSQGSQGSHLSQRTEGSNHSRVSHGSKGSSSIVVEDEKESISDATSQAGSFESNSSEYAECQVLYEADPDAIRMEDINEREWQPFVLPDTNPAQMNYPLERSPAVANMRDLYTIREEDERSRASTRGSPRSNESPRIVRQGGIIVVTTTPSTGLPPAYNFRKFSR